MRCVTFPFIQPCSASQVNRMPWTCTACDRRSWKEFVCSACFWNPGISMLLEFSIKRTTLRTEFMYNISFGNMSRSRTQQTRKYLLHRHETSTHENGRMSPCLHIWYYSATKGLPPGYSRRGVLRDSNLEPLASWKQPTITLHSSCCITSNARITNPHNPRESTLVWKNQLRPAVNSMWRLCGKAKGTLPDNNASIFCLSKNPHDSTWPLGALNKYFLKWFASALSGLSGFFWVSGLWLRRAMGQAFIYLIILITLLLVITLINYF